jgi:hypothetical protein
MAATSKATTQKVSVSIDRAQLRWARSVSRRMGTSVSSILSEALRLYHEEKARELAALELLEQFGTKDHASPVETDQLLAKWRG